MHVLLAFDKFKDALTAPEACDLAADAMRRDQPDWTYTRAPLTDGGEGFAPILTLVAGGTLHEVEVSGPQMRPAPASYGVVRLGDIPTEARALLNLPADWDDEAKIAVIEMAAASGLMQVPTAERSPFRTTSRGTGELMAHAIEHGCAAILLGVGGSATHDIGLGALQALGFTLRGSEGTPHDDPRPEAWGSIMSILAPSRPLGVPVRIACDVANPLLGEQGAAAVYGPQKGLLAADYPQLEAGTARLAGLLQNATSTTAGLAERPGAGAAGGIAYGLMAGVGAELLPGIELVNAWLALDAKLAAADIVLTGEGRFDASSLQGKGPGAVARTAAELGKRAYVFAGAVTTEAPPGISLHAISPPGLPLPEAIAQTPMNLVRAVQSQSW